MIYNKFLENIVLPIGDRIVGSHFMQELKKLRIQDTKSEEELQSIQREKLKRLLDFSVEHSPYYRELLLEKSDDPYVFVKSFPILEKDILRQYPEKLLTKKKESLIRQNSSGSSGLQTSVYFDKYEQSIQRAYQIRWWEWAGYKIGTPVLQTGITPNRGLLKKMKDLLFRTYYLQAFTHDEAEVIEALKWAEKQKSVVLAGYASSLYVLSRFATKNALDVCFDTAISWGDKLFDHYKESIEGAFRTKVHDTYASSEGFMIAAQKDLKYMYIMTSDVYLEIIDENGNEVEDGELGHVVVTKLNNYSMPLIRYRLGDLAIKLPREKYPRQREYAYPLLEKVIGRDTDLVRTRRGKYMVVHSFTGIFEHYETIRQYRVIQRDLDGIEIQYIPDTGFDKSVLERIEREIREYLSEKAFKITFSEVKEILPTPSGKPQIVQSFLKGL